MELKHQASSTFFDVSQLLSQLNLVKFRIESIKEVIDAVLFNEFLEGNVIFRTFGF